MSRFEWNRKFFGSAELVARHRAADPACTNAFDGELPIRKRVQVIVMPLGSFSEGPKFEKKTTSSPTLPTKLFTT